MIYWNIQRAGRRGYKFNINDNRESIDNNSKKRGLGILYKYSKSKIIITIKI